MATQDISSVIKKQIEEYGDNSSLVDVGTVVEAGDGIAQIHGLSNVKYSELLEFPNGTLGMALNLEEDTVGTVVLGDYLDIKEGDEVKVKVIGFDRGKVKLSMKQASEWSIDLIEKNFKL